MSEHGIGDRVDGGWIFSSSGADDGNLSPEFLGNRPRRERRYAEYVRVPAPYV